MSLWILVTLAAAAMQTVRFMLQKQLKGAGLSTGGATFARFIFAAPLAALVASLALAVSGEAFPPLTARFWTFALVGGVGQIVATLATVALFSLRNFAVGIAFTKTETVQVAAFSALILGEAVSLWGWSAIGVGFAGVLLLSRASEGGLRFDPKATALGLLAGGFFGISAIGYRGATLELMPLGFFLRAVLTLACVTASQTVMMAVWLKLRQPGEAGRVVRTWRKTALVGLTGMLGSLGWFTAFSLQNAALVRAVGQVEIVFTLVASALVFRERLHLREAAGIALVVTSLLMIVLALG
ncbi:DMT family transporter [Ostreiculturibacter nitratireducens]|uniref:DMT family transporter n=1 Tax=Ostreiculturibacter nitratireducens TaxID=3075226 RepID=UPI0031B61610